MHRRALLELPGARAAPPRAGITPDSTALRLRERVPEDVVLVAESGIKTRADVERLEAAGIQAMLVGESLLKQPDPGAAAAALLGR